MRRGVYLFLFVLILAQPCFAEPNYRIEVLQVGAVDVYDGAYEGILDGLARQGLVKGYNVNVNRTVLDMNPEPSFWERLTLNMRIGDMLSSVIGNRPDLVITLGTQATAIFHDKVREAGIPAVFSGVCSPVARSGKDGTGVVIRSQPSDMIRTTMLALPDIDRLAIIHSSDPEGISFTDEVSREAGKFGITVISRKIDPSEPVSGAVSELIARGADAFIIPTDAYYEDNGWKVARELIAQATLQRIPCVSSLLNTTKGPLITLAPDFGAVGDLTANQIKEILVHGKLPGDLAIASHTNQNFIVDLNSSRRLGIHFRPKTNSFYSLNH